MNLTEHEIITAVSNEMGTQEKGARYGVALMTLFAGLEGTQMTRSRIFAASAIGSAMRGFDDAFDKGGEDSAKSTVEAIEFGVNGTVLPSGLKQGISIATDNLNPTANGVLVSLAKAQLSSKRQKDAGIGLDEITLITEEKGGLTAMLFASAVNEDISNEKQEAYRQLGVLMQMIDDYIDREEDLKDGIQTLLTLSGDKCERTMLILRQFLKVKTACTLAFTGEKLIKVLDYAKRLVVSTGVMI